MLGSFSGRFAQNAGRVIRNAASLNSREFSVLRRPPVTMNLVTRDWDQGLNNAVPFTDPLMQQVHKDAARINGAGPNIIKSIEHGGAELQRKGMHLGINPFAEIRDLSSILSADAQDISLRYLIRNASGFGMNPQDPQALAFLIKNTALAGQFMRPEAEAIFKIFDSQAVTTETLSTLRVVKELRANGINISGECAIPFSMGASYPVEWYLRKVEEAAQAGFDSFSIKSMVGDGNRQFLHELVSKSIPVWKNNSDKPVQIGLHFHDLGNALDSYIGGVLAAVEGGANVDFDVVPDGALGFVGILAAIDALEKLGVRLGITDEQREIISNMNRSMLLLQEAYSAAIPQHGLSNEELQKFCWPGGGVASAVSNIRAEKIPELLGKNLHDAIREVGKESVNQRKKMGDIHPVTPGFQMLMQMTLFVLKNRAAGKPDYEKLPHNLCQFVRGEKPGKVDGYLFDAACKGNLETCLNLLIQGKEHKELKENILRFHSTNKKSAEQLLRESNLPEETIAKVVAEIGAREYPMSDRPIGPKLEVIKAEIEKIGGNVPQQQKDDLIAFDAVGGIQDALKLPRLPRDRFPNRWEPSAKGKTPEQYVEDVKKWRESEAALSKPASERTYHPDVSALWTERVSGHGCCETLRENLPASLGGR